MSELNWWRITYFCSCVCFCHFEFRKSWYSNFLKSTSVHLILKKLSMRLKRTKIFLKKQMYSFFQGFIGQARICSVSLDDLLLHTHTEPHMIEFTEQLYQIATSSQPIPIPHPRSFHHQVLFTNPTLPRSQPQPYVHQQLKTISLKLPLPSFHTALSAFSHPSGETFYMLLSVNFFWHAAGSQTIKPVHSKNGAMHNFDTSTKKLSCWDSFRLWISTQT